MKIKLCILVGGLMAANWVFAATATINGVTWSYGTTTGNKACIAGATNAKGSVTVPSTLGAYTVTTIAQNAFYGNSEMTQITIPSTVTTIYWNSFTGCEKLAWISVSTDNSSYSSYDGALYNKNETILIFCPAAKSGSVSIPSTVTSIQADFNDCKEISSITVAAGNSSYSSYDGVLYNKAKTMLIRCPRAKSGQVNVPEGVVSIGESGGGLGFRQCDQITGVHLPSTLTTFYVGGDYAGFIFYGCTSLQTITVAEGNTVFSIVNGMLCRDNYTYDYWPETSYKDGKCLLVCPGGLTSVVIPDEIRKIGNRAFAGGSVKYVAISPRVTSIGEQAFEGCHSIGSILIPSSVKLMGEYALGFCTNLSSVVFCGSPGIGKNPFYGCSALTTIICTGDKLPYGDYHYDSEWDWTGDEDSLCTGASSCRTLLKHNGATSAGPYDVGDYDWKDMNYTGSVDSPWPAGGPYCESAGDCQLYFTVNSDGYAVVCGGINTISINSDYHGHLVLPECLGNCTVTSIASGAFVSCTWLSSVTVSTNITAIGAGAFDSEGISEVISDAGDTAHIRALLQASGVNVGNIAFKECQVAEGISWEYQILDEGVRVLGVDKTLSEMFVPSTLGGRSVIEIGTGAFRGGAEITSMTIPAGVQLICDDAFDGCLKLVAISFEGNTPELESNAFRSVPATCAVYVKKSSSGWSTEIPGNWNGLKIQYAEDAVFTETTNGVQWMIQLDGMLVPSATKSISAQLSGRVVLPSVVGGKTVTCVGQGLLAGATKVREVEISDSVREIESSAFERCSRLESIVIPDGVVSIGDNAFRECVSLRAITIPASVTNIGCFAFKDCRNLDEIHLLGENIVLGVGAFETKPTVVEVASERVVVESTNVVIHYVVNSAVPEKTYPATYDTGFVNIITEVKSGGAVSVPATWMVNYPDYVTKFGADFTKSLMKPTGKRDGAGNAMCVWQDYVAGTDPTDEDDKFTASITIDADGNLIISYSPELIDAEKALRVYKTWGKVKLTDADWVEVPEGHNADYNFFKVTVEMK